jgi:3alpha(or 20beta)-hydroxysteroid dehydrogenase
VLGIMRCAAAEFAYKKIRVNAICPGAIDTPILGPLHGQTEMLQTLMGANHPIGRVGQADEVGRLVAFLASDDASFITGATIPIDGGVTSIQQMFTAPAMQIGESA